MMVNLTKSQNAIVKSAAEFARGEFDAEQTREMDKTGAFPESIRAMAADLGFIGIHLPEKYSGGGLGMVEHLLVAETFSRHDATTGAAIMLSGVGTECLAYFAGEAQKAAYLPDILEGRICMGTFNACVGSGSNMGMLAAETTMPDSLVLNGETDLILNASSACVYLVSVNEGRDSTSTSLFVVDAASEGIRLANEISTLGLRMTSMARVKMENVVVPKTNRVGGPGKGMRQIRLMRCELRLLLAALCVGTAQGAFDRGCAHARQREQFGRKISEFQAIRHKLARMATQIQQARALTYRAAAEFNPKKPDPGLSAMASVSASDAAVAVSSDAIQLLGGYGYTTEYDVERYYRDAKALQTIKGGRLQVNDEIAAAVVGK
jgi:alkylation response protein AidB-like acyl-CoA dehydrogenase